MVNFISRMLQWYSCIFSFQGCYSGINACFSRDCHQCQRGRLLACFLNRGRVCVFVIDGEDQHDQMAKINMIRWRRSTRSVA
jgi:hypothetical protein